MAYDRKDHFHQRAKREGVRSRAFYKLEQIQRKHKLLRRGQRVADLGCWPGGWLEAAARVVGPKGRVVGVDLAEITPPIDYENVVAFVADLEDPGTYGKVLAELGGSCDVLLSDAAPKLTGIRDADRAAEERLLEAIESLVPQLLAPKGTLLLKLLEGPEAQAIAKRLKRSFGQSKSVVPEATRKGSTERYLLATDYRP